MKDAGCRPRQADKPVQEQDKLCSVGGCSTHRLKQGLFRLLTGHWLSCRLVCGVSKGLTEPDAPQEKKQQLEKVQKTLKEMAEIDHWQASAILLCLCMYCSWTMVTR